MGLTTLTLIPPSLLPSIFRYLEAEDVRTLVELTGDTTMRRQCTAYGGVTELRADTRVSAISVLILGRFPTIFAHLTKLVIELDTNMDYTMPVAPLWAMHLPATLKEIHFSFDVSIEVFVEPLAPHDDDYTRFVLGVHLNKPMNLAKSFPNLTVLRLQSLLRGRNYINMATGVYWNQALVQRFVHDLPPSLTHLQLPYWCYNYLSTSATPKWPLFYHLRALRNVQIDLAARSLLPFLLAWHPPEVAGALEKEIDAHAVAMNYPIARTGESSTLDMDSATNKLIEFDYAASLLSVDSLLPRVIAPMIHLESLSLTSVPLDTWSMAFQRLETLEHLSLNFDLSPSILPPPSFLLFSLPPNLTSLRLVDVPIGTDVSTLLKRVPQLVDFHLQMADCNESAWLPARLGQPALPIASSEAGVVNLTYLPPALTRLNIQGLLPVRLCALPTSLTRFSCQVAILNLSSLHLTRNARLSSLSLLSWSALQPISQLASFPPGLTYFDASMTRYSIEQLQRLPQSIRFLKLRVALALKDKALIGKFYNHDAIAANIHKQYLPHVTNLVIDSFFFTDELIQEMKRHCNELAEYRVSELLPSLFYSADDLPMPHCQVFECAPRMAGFCMKPSAFSRSLTELSVNNVIISASRSSEALPGPHAHRPLKKELNLTLAERERSDDTNSLPKGLTSLSFIAFDIVHDGELSYFSPFLSALPLLTKFCIRKCSNLYEQCIKTLPKTITDLTIQVEDHILLFELPPDWLPLLVRLELHSCDLHYSAIVNQVKNMTSIEFHSSTLVVPGDVLPEEWKERDMDVIGPAAIHRQCLRLLPPRLRRSRIKFAVDWTLKVVVAFLLSLRDMTFPRPATTLPEKAFDLDYGLHLPSKSLTYLDVVGVSPSVEHSSFSSLPSGLLSFRVKHVDANQYEQLPASLTSLFLVWLTDTPAPARASYTLSEQLLQSLPRGLQELQLQSGSTLFEVPGNGLAALPPSLVSLGLCLARTTVDENPWHLLPTSLVSVTLGPSFHNVNLKSSTPNILHRLCEALPRIRWVSNGWNRLENLLDGN